MSLNQGMRARKQPHLVASATFFTVQFEAIGGRWNPVIEVHIWVSVHCESLTPTNNWSAVLFLQSFPPSNPTFLLSATFFYTNWLVNRDDGDVSKYSVWKQQLSLPVWQVRRL